MGKKKKHSKNNLGKICNLISGLRQNVCKKRMVSFMYILLIYKLNIF